MLDNLHPEQVSSKWNQARRAATIRQLLGSLTGDAQALVSFDDVAHRLRLKNYRYLGAQTIPTHKIVGSIGRYNDFLRGFLPTHNIKKDRWMAVAREYLKANGPGMPPIDVFKVGDSYFVRDGNHRVSVCNHLGIPFIEAYVWEYRIQIDAVTEGSSLDELLLAAERQEFHEQTTIDQCRPQHHIDLTLPGGYLDLLHEINHYQVIFSTIDDTPVSFEDAVTGWYDMRYEPIVQLIERHNMLAQFKGRTSTDLYVFTLHEHTKLKANTDSTIRVTQALRVVSETRRGRLRRWWWQVMKRFYRNN